MPLGPGPADAGPSGISGTSGSRNPSQAAPTSSTYPVNPAGQPGAYFGYGTPWQYNSWQAPYGMHATPHQVASHQGAAYQYLAPGGTFPQHVRPAQTPQTPQPRPPSPSPPPQSLPRHWDVALRQFLTDSGLTQALRGLELDMLVLNEDRERKTVPAALQTFRTSLSVRARSFARASWSD